MIAALAAIKVLARDQAAFAVISAGGGNVGEGRGRQRHGKRGGSGKRFDRVHRCCCGFDSWLRLMGNGFKRKDAQRLAWRVRAAMEFVVCASGIEIYRKLQEKVLLQHCIASRPVGTEKMH